MALDKKSVADGYSLRNDDGTYSPYAGYVQSRMSCFNRGHIHEFMITSELSRQYNNPTLRVVLNELFYKLNYVSNPTMYDHTV